MSRNTYESAGVSIAAGEEAVERIKSSVRSTFRPEVIGDIGGFGGLFAFAKDRYREPVLVSSTDGVGTKAQVARLTRRFDTIGEDLVAMCVDDIAAQGAEPLFFLDYISIGKLDPDQVEQLVAGVVTGCRHAGCALVGGEMAEHPGVMEPGDFDLVGFTVGVAERNELVTGDAIRPGDVVIGLPSPGLRSNGYSLARRVLLDIAARPLDAPAWDGAAHSLADELLLPSVIYSPALVALCRAVDVHGMAHVTGGGIPGNLARVLPPGCDAVIRRGAWSVPPIFGEIQRLGDVDDAEMAKVFNLGLGMLTVVPAHDVFQALDLLRGRGHDAVQVGEIVRGGGLVHLE
ncbi:MAG TPA: phosphoribosylformylglycinamidine cyclo-ligase [Acidimicrobiales bacterium]|nr:phosphoribosylformylglycinamidine cyclo-ligase [Acidimicrobiales bacterium]